MKNCCTYARAYVRMYVYKHTYHTLQGAYERHCGCSIFKLPAACQWRKLLSLYVCMHVCMYVFKHTHTGAPERHCGCLVVELPASCRRRGTVILCMCTNTQTYMCTWEAMRFCVLLSCLQHVGLSYVCIQTHARTGAHERHCSCLVVELSPACRRRGTIIGGFQHYWE